MTLELLLALSPQQFFAVSWCLFSRMRENCSATGSRQRTVGKFQHVFESSAQPPPRSITREQAARISANWLTTFYQLQLGSFEFAEFYEKPLPHWLVCFANTASGPTQHLVFAVVLPDGQIVQPNFSEGL